MNWIIVELSESHTGRYLYLSGFVFMSYDHDWSVNKNEAYTFKQLTHAIQSLDMVHVITPKAFIMPLVDALPELNY